MSQWVIEPAALNLLETHGGPFTTGLVRQALLDTFPDWSEASVGARMADGTTAAVGLIRIGNRLESIPYGYGGVVGSRPLRADEVAALLEFVRHQQGAARLECRSLALGINDHSRHDGGTVVGWSQVVYLPKGHPPETRWAYKARRAVRIAREGGGSMRLTNDPASFLRLYRRAAISHVFRLPIELLEGLAKAGALRFYEVVVGKQVVSSIAALTHGSNWLAWLAAQDEAGREISGNYLAAATLLEDAHRRGVPVVDLGISTGMPTVAHFKRRFDAVDVPVIRHSAESWSLQAANTARRNRQRLSRLVRHTRGH